MSKRKAKQIKVVARPRNDKGKKLRGLGKVNRNVELHIHLSSYPTAKSFLGFIAIAILCFVLVCPATTHAGGVAVNRNKIIVEIDAGGSATGQVLVSNPDEIPKQVNFYFQDWCYDKEKQGSATGRKSFFEPGTLKNSCSNWLSLSALELSLEANQTLPVNFKVDCPVNASGMYYTILLCEINLTPDSSKGVGVMIKGRLGILVKVIVKNTLKKDCAFGEVEIKENIITIPFSNIGNCGINPIGVYFVENDAGDIVGRGVYKQIYTMPGDNGVLRAEFLKLPDGNYTILSSFDLDDDARFIEYDIAVK